MIKFNFKFRIIKFVRKLFCKNKIESEPVQTEVKLDPTKHTEREITALGFTLASDFDCVFGRAYERKKESSK